MVVPGWPEKSQSASALKFLRVHGLGVFHRPSLAVPITLAGHLTSVPVALSCALQLVVLGLLAAGGCRAEQAGGDSDSSEKQCTLHNGLALFPLP